MPINPRIQDVIHRLPHWEVPPGAPADPRPLTQEAVEHLETVLARLSTLEGRVARLVERGTKRLPVLLQRATGVAKRVGDAGELWLDLHASMVAVEASLGGSDFESLLDAKLPAGLEPFDRQTAAIIRPQVTNAIAAWRKRDPWCLINLGKGIHGARRTLEASAAGQHYVREADARRHASGFDARAAYRDLFDMVELTGAEYFADMPEFRVFPFENPSGRAMSEAERLGVQRILEYLDSERSFDSLGGVAGHLHARLHEVARGSLAEAVDWSVGDGALRSYAATFLQDAAMTPSPTEWRAAMEVCRVVTGMEAMWPQLPVASVLEQVRTATRRYHDDPATDRWEPRRQLFDALVQAVNDGIRAPGPRSKA